MAEITPGGKRLVVRATKAVTAAFAEMPFGDADAKTLFKVLQRFRQQSGDFLSAVDQSGVDAGTDVA